VNKLHSVIFGLAILVCAGCSSSVTGIVEKIEPDVGYFSQDGNVGISGNFTAVTILAGNDRHLASWPSDLPPSFHQGDMISFKLETRGPVTVLPAHLVTEGDVTHVV